MDQQTKSKQDPKQSMSATVGRVRRSTAEAVNQRIHEETEARLAFYEAHPEQIDDRLRELDKEWDIERAIELESGSMVLMGLALGSLFGKKWFLIPAFAAGMVLLHNVNGTYPLLPLFRRMGIRTAQEIAAERYALKALRGDFDHVPEEHADAEAMAQVYAATRPI